MKRFWRRNTEDDDIIDGEVEDIQAEDEGEYDESYWAPPATSPTQERVAPDVPTPDEMHMQPYISAPASGAETVVHEAPRRRRVRLPRLPRLINWGEVNPGLAIITTGLVVGGIFWTLANLGATSATVDTWWPGVFLALSVAWALYTLLTRQASPFLAAAALSGLSVSLLLHTHDLLLWRETVLGSVLIAVGLGVIVRGLVLRQGTTA